MTLEGLMQQYGFRTDPNYEWDHPIAYIHVETHLDRYRVSFYGIGYEDDSLYLYPRTLQALQAILESVDPIPEPPKPKTFEYEIGQSLGRVVIDRNSGVRGVITNAYVADGRMLVDITIDHGSVTAVMQ